jgi:hypothetical protein
MGFLKTIRNSIYSPDFYASIPQKKLGSAIGYFFLLILFAAIAQSISPVWSFLTVGQTEVKKFVNTVKNIYPSELVIKIQKGKVSTNVQEPYFIPLPENKNMIAEDNFNLVVIDTKTPFSVNQFNQYRAFAWITEDSVFTKSDNQIKANDLSKASNITIDKTLVSSLINRFSPWINLITPLAITGISLGLYLFHSLRLVYLFFLAALIWILTKFLKKPLSYGNSYKTGLYAMTLGLFAEVFLGFFKFAGFTFMFTLISLAIVLMNKLPKTEEIPPPQSPQPTPVPK